LVKHERAITTATLALVTLPLCLFLYLVGCGVAQAILEPHVAPLRWNEVVDHFHIEVYLEVLFLAGSVMWRPSRARLWVIVLIGFETEQDWFEYGLENHPEFLRQVQEARIAIRGGLGTRLEDIPR
jgi:hypothetical protein